jgi:hypothetical protein
MRMCVSMCVCMHVCMYLYVFMCVYARVCMCVCVCVCVWEGGKGEVCACGGRVERYMSVLSVCLCMWYVKSNVRDDGCIV